MQPITFQRTNDSGGVNTRIAYTPAEAVKLRFDGWTEVVPESKPAASTATTTRPVQPPKPPAEA